MIDVLVVVACSVAQYHLARLFITNDLPQNEKGVPGNGPQAGNRTRIQFLGDFFCRLQRFGDQFALICFPFQGSAQYCRRRGIQIK